MKRALIIAALALLMLAAGYFFRGVINPASRGGQRPDGGDQRGLHPGNR